MYTFHEQNEFSKKVKCEESPKMAAQAQFSSGPEHN